MATSLRDRYQADLEEARRRSGGGQFWSPDKGENRIRILPAYYENDPFYAKVGQHYGLGSDGKASVYCPKIIIGQKEDCPICEFVDTVKKKSNKPRELEMAKKFAVKMRFFAYILDRGRSGSDEPRIWGYGSMIQQNLLELVIGDEYKDLLDLEYGNDLILKRDGEGLETKYTIYPASKSSRVPSSVMDEISDLNAYVEERLLTADELEKVLDGKDPNEVFDARSRGSARDRDDREDRDRSSASSRREEERGRGGRDRDDDRSAGRDRERDDDARHRRGEREEPARGRDRERDDDRGRDRDDRRERDRDREEPRGRDRDDRGGRDREDRRSDRDREEPRGRERDRDDRDDRSRDDDRDREPRGRRRESRDDDRGRSDADDAAEAEITRLAAEATGDSKGGRGRSRESEPEPAGKGESGGRRRR